MEKYTATIVDKTDNTLVLVPDVIKSGYIINSLVENNIVVSPRIDNNLSTEECTVMLFYDNWLNTVLGNYHVGDKIGINYERINQ